MSVWRGSVLAMAGALALLAATPALAAPKSKPAARSDAKAEAKDPRVWVLARADDTLVLRYGSPRVADPAFAVACQPAAQLIQFMAEVSAAKVKAGDGVALSLGVGKRRLELAASAFRAATDGRVVVEAAVSLDTRPIDLLGEGETLVVRVPGASESYPLAGAKAKLADFRKACLARR
ncbi:hypothetical protein V5F49_04635 [Xanthobacter sp. V3C-3]|uniref:hypothetical protein n=1 Tax=Xanthobacter lutulentifluminis TaxID=3119935 RepID=UPI00372828C2